MPFLKPGSIRGNHYHAHAFEYVFVFSGPCKTCFFDQKTGDAMEIIVTDKEPKLFKIAPYTTHAFKNIGRNNIFLLCYEERIRKTETADTQRLDILL